MERYSDFTEEQKTKRRANHRRYRNRVKLQALEQLGGVCTRCGFNDHRALQIDHIQPVGSKKRHGGMNTVALRRIARGETDNLQLLCANCNWIKRFENDETAWNTVLFPSSARIRGGRAS